MSDRWTERRAIRQLTLTCITALNQHVFPTFFSPTGQFSCRFLSWGLGESLHTSVCVRFRLALFSAMLASRTLKHGETNPKQNVIDLIYGYTAHHIVFYLNESLFLLLRCATELKEICESAPADGLLFIGDARLPEGPVRLLQTEGDGTLKVIFIVSGEIDYIWNDQARYWRQTVKKNNNRLMFRF